MVVFFAEKNCTSVTEISRENPSGKKRFPSITKSEQLAVIVLVVPETASQVAAKTTLK